MTENIENRTVPSGSFAEKLEPALTFLSSPWKIWESGSVAARKLVLKLAFTDRIRYCRKEGARTAELAFPFKALSGFTDHGFCYGARKRRFCSSYRHFFSWSFQQNKGYAR
ncbi:hypothetical protein RLO149_c028810 [Roseobacter litoralis Och 149]|uniref:Uncharacterized protein n=1 Tax=Roseobacter litoralis (strain ATCC 49566 / DSM 6996 / JCM 21268 / NBRC 15278 / OCh 149) TaxID=391595 RepID=F7ZGA9_ROSLO|nr:hypothetical protein RLO149_c028810 [Roseobacter litoralis Och 149]